MEQSILTSTKKALGIGPEDDSFDLDIMTHINAAFSTLQQLGIGPENGFTIEDESSTWAELGLDELTTNNVKPCVFLKVKLVFDPPGTQFLLASMEKQIEQLEWRLNVQREENDWVDPNPDGSDIRTIEVD